MSASVTDDIRAGLALRNQGQADVQAADVAAHKGNGEYIRSALAVLTARGTEFTTDDVRRWAERLADAAGHHFDPHPNLWGSILGGAASAGRIRRVGEANSARRTRHASRNAVWRAA